MKNSKIIGIDLAGVEHRETGFCIMQEFHGCLWVKTIILYRDEEIVSECVKEKPNLISIDAPLALPKGRCCLKDECSCRSKGHLRECDKELLKMGIKFFPVTLGPMRKLTMRGIKLRKILESKDFKVIETYPGGAQDLLGLPRKKDGIEKLRNGLIKLGIKGDILKSKITDHELDAITSALVGKMYLEGNFIAIGNSDEILMILPKKRF
jgi:predicted nuclease with RNAse H fold